MKLNDLIFIVSGLMLISCECVVGYQRSLPQNIYIDYDTLTDPVLTTNVVDQIHYADPTRPIYLHINSGGGVVKYGEQIINAMHKSKSPVITINEEMAASMAEVILINGDYIMEAPHSQVMIHAWSSECYSNLGGFYPSSPITTYTTDKITKDVSTDTAPVDPSISWLDNICETQNKLMFEQYKQEDLNGIYKTILTPDQINYLSQSHFNQLWLNGVDFNKQLKSAGYKVIPYRVTDDNVSLDKK